MVVKVKDLQLGDTVHMHCEGGMSPWSTSIVKEIDSVKQTVTFFRPYGTTADFSCGDNVICYIGIEVYTVSMFSPIQYVLLSRKDLR